MHVEGMDSIIGILDLLIQRNELNELFISSLCLPSMILIIRLYLVRTFLSFCKESIFISSFR